MLAKWIKVEIKPERRQDFLAAIEVDAVGSETDEPGCVRFNVLQDAEDENVYYFYEVYTSEAAVTAHREAPHYAVWRAAADTLAAPPQRIECRSVFPSDAAYWLRGKSADT